MHATLRTLGNSHFSINFPFADLKNEKKKREMEHRILLLGCGEAGKSTFIKQMRIIHSGGFSEAEKLDIKRAIASNILSSVQTLLENSTSEAWSEQMEDDARIIETLNLRGVHPRVSDI